jgi:tripartite-type tricarboxylate transporter receptor subunit TctC
MKRVLATGSLLCAFGIAALAAPAAADSVGDFYKTKGLTMIIGTSTGGSYDTVARLMARHLGKQVPGKPSIVTQNRPGASGRVAANSLYNTGPRDGSVIAALSQTLAFAQLLGQRGVKYDASKFNWIGTPTQPVSVMVASNRKGVKSLLDARKTELIVGATSSTGANFIYPALANYLFGTKLKIIIGYKGGNEVDLALDRGEIDVRGSGTWTNIKYDHPDWIREKKVTMLIQNSLKKHPDLPDVPRFVDLAENADQRAVLNLMGQVASVGRPLLTNRGVPGDRLAALRSAFDATMKDGAFKADAARLKLDLDPLGGAELQKMIGEMLSVPKKVVDITNAALARNGTQCAKFTDPKYCRKAKKKKKKKKRD